MRVYSIGLLVVANLLILIGAPLHGQAAAKPRKIARGMFGNAALTILVDGGRVEAVPTEADSVSYVIERLDPAAPTPYVKYRESFGPEGFTIEQMYEESRPALKLRIEIPRWIKSVRIDMRARGEVVATAVNAEVTVRVMSGPVTLMDVGGPLLVEALDGPVTASISSTESSAVVSILASHGDVTLSVPTRARFTFDAAARCGLIRSEFGAQSSSLRTPVRREGCPSPLPSVRDRYTSSELSAINGGGRIISVRTTFGSIILERRQ